MVPSSSLAAVSHLAVQADCNVSQFIGLGDYGGYVNGLLQFHKFFWTVTDGETRRWSE